MLASHDRVLLARCRLATDHCSGIDWPGQALTDRVPGHLAPVVTQSGRRSLFTISEDRWIL
jgi:hypothetical protein